MPHKQKDKKKGRPFGGSYKTGKSLKDILQANPSYPERALPSIVRFYLTLTVATHRSLT